jgi:hypothetical protein
MKCTAVPVFFAALGILAVAAPANAAGHGARRRWHDNTGDLSRRIITPPTVADPNKDAGDKGVADDPLEWMKDFDAAAKLATDEKRPLMVLFSNENAERTVDSCHFATRTTRQAARGASVVPVKLLAPQPVTNPELLSPEEAKRRGAEFEKAKEKFEALIKRYSIAKVPTLLLAAPDSEKIEILVAPSDDEVCSGLARLPDAVKAHVAADKKAEEAKNKPPEGKDNKVADGPKPPVEPAAPKGPKPGDEEDF